MLLGAKVSPEIAETRNVPLYQDVISPNEHSEFSTPGELLKFVQKLRDFSERKPVGIKLCIEHPWELIAIIKAMVQTNIYLDFITFDEPEVQGRNSIRIYGSFGKPSSRSNSIC